MDVESAKRVILVDDLRSFTDGRNAEVARTSAAGRALLHAHRDKRIDELWLDHDLGDNDTIWPVVEVLEHAAFVGQPLNIGAVYIHSANPSGSQPRWRRHYDDGGIPSTSLPGRQPSVTSPPNPGAESISVAAFGVARS